MYSGTWLCGWRWSGSIVSHLRPILPDIGLAQEPICLSGLILRRGQQKPALSSTNLAVAGPDYFLVAGNARSMDSGVVLTGSLIPRYTLRLSGQILGARF